MISEEKNWMGQTWNTIYKRDLIVISPTTSNTLYLSFLIHLKFLSASPVSPLSAVWCIIQYTLCFSNKTKNILTEALWFWYHHIDIQILFGEIWIKDFLMRVVEYWTHTHTFNWLIVVENLTPINLKGKFQSTITLPFHVLNEYFFIYMKSCKCL